MWPPQSGSCWRLAIHTRGVAQRQVCCRLRLCKGRGRRQVSHMHLFMSGWLTRLTLVKRVEGWSVSFPHLILSFSHHMFVLALSHLAQCSPWEQYSWGTRAWGVHTCSPCAQKGQELHWSGFVYETVNSQSAQRYALPTLVPSLSNTLQLMMTNPTPNFPV